MSIMNEIMDEIFGEHMHDLIRNVLSDIDNNIYYFDYVEPGTKRKYMFDFFKSSYGEWQIGIERSLKDFIKVDDLQSIIQKDHLFTVRFEHPNSIEDCKKLINRWIKLVNK